MDRENLSWSVAVPIGTNPLLVRNFMFVVSLLSFSLFGVIIATQSFFGGEIELLQIRSAFFISLRFWGLLCFVYFFIVFVLLNNRYVSHYVAGDSGIKCDRIRIDRSSWRGGFWNRLPFEAPLKYREVTSTSRLVRWDSISSIKEFEEYRTVVLMKGRFSVMRLFCPDQTTYDMVLAMLKDKILERG